MLPSSRNLVLWIGGAPDCTVAGGQWIRCYNGMYGECLCAMVGVCYRTCAVISIGIRDHDQGLILG